MFLTVQNQTISLLALIEGNGMTLMRPGPKRIGGRWHTAALGVPKRLLSLRPSRFREKTNDQRQGINFGGLHSSNLLFW